MPTKKRSSRRWQPPGRVRPLAAARCDGDKVFLFHDVTRPAAGGNGVALGRHSHAGSVWREAVRVPFGIGHECVAEVVSCGEAVTRFQRRDVVIVPWSVSCGGCQHCHLGLTAKCLTAGDTFVSAYGFGSSQRQMSGGTSMRDSLVRKL